MIKALFPVKVDGPFSNLIKSIFLKSNFVFDLKHKAKQMYLL